MIPTRLNQQVLNGTVVCFDRGAIIVMSDRVASVPIIKLKSLDETIANTLARFDPGYEWPSSRLIDYINSQGFDYTCTLTKRVLRTDLKWAMLVTRTTIPPFLSLESLVMCEVAVGSKISTCTYFISDGFPGSVVMPIMRITGRSV